MRIALVVASLGRPSIVADLLASLRRQTRAPNTIVLCVESGTDLPPGLPDGVVVLRGPRGASAQRNRGLSHCRESHDVVVFMDDDYVPGRRFLEHVAVLFERHPDIVGATGTVLADGVTSGGIGRDDAERLVGAHDAAGRVSHAVSTGTRLYGCNMAVRCAATRDVWFDENLPLYSWQEDIDFAGQLRGRGRLVRSEALVGVHRGVAGARTSGVRFGYSQIVNPVYLVRKGTMGIGHAAGLIGRNLLANHAKALTGSGPIDRRGRVRGNWIGIADVLRGRADPRRILQFGEDPLRPPRTPERTARP